MSYDKRSLKRLRAGDKDALRRIYEKYMDDLLGVALSILCDIQAAEDCLHDVFVTLVGGYYGLMARSNPEATFVSCVTNRDRETHILRT